MRTYNRAKGVEVPGSKLKPEDVLYIRENCVVSDPRKGLSAMGRKFNVDHSTIRAVVHFETWKHISHTTEGDSE